MKIKNWITFNESKGVDHFLQLKKVIENIKDILIELDDNDIKYEIYPENDLKIKELSLKMRGFMGGVIDGNFYVKLENINLEKINFEDFKESWLYYTLKHLENYIKSLDIYERKLRTQYVLIKSKRYSFSREIKVFNTIEDIENIFKDKESSSILLVNNFYIFFN